MRLVSKNIGCSKRFPGANAIKALATLQHWLGELAAEIVERIDKDIEENARRPRNMTVSFSQAAIAGAEVASSRTVPLSAPAMVDAGQLAAEALAVIKRNTDVFFRPTATAATIEQRQASTVLNNPIRFLGISVGKFESDAATTAATAGNTIRSMFSAVAARANLAKETKPEYLLCDDIDTIATERPTDEGETGVHENDSHVSVKTSEQDEPTAVYEKDSTTATKTNNRSDVNDAAEHAIERKAFFTVKPKESVNESKVSDANDNSTDENNVDTAAMAAMAYLDDTQEEETTTTAQELPAYMREYAEFHLPSVGSVESVAVSAAATATTSTNVAGAAPPFEQCTKCAELVPRSEVQSHADAHFAIEISRRERLDLQTNAPRNAQQPNEIERLPVAMITETLTEAAATPAAVAFERCTTCNKRVPLPELQSHADAHFAFQISQEQRREYRNQIATNSASKQPPAKRTKLSQSTFSASSSAASSAASQPSPKRSAASCPAGGLISRFLVPSKEVNSSIAAAAEPPADHVRCTECSKFVPVADVQLHADYHTARRLQRELNNSSSSIKSTTTKPPKATAKNNVIGVAQFFRSKSDVS